jgi:hypothetical protein
MVSDLDIYRSAKVLVDQYGDGAPLRAGIKAEKFSKAGDLEGAAVWFRILTAAEELLAKDRPPKATVQ